MKSLAVFLALAVVCICGISYAEIYQSGNNQQNGDGQGPPPEPPAGNATVQGKTGGEHRAPPQAAIDACSGKAEGAVCQCQGPRGTESGTCSYTPDKKYFACKPAHMGKDGQCPPGGQKPPANETARGGE